VSNVDGEEKSIREQRNKTIERKREREREREREERERETEKEKEKEEYWTFSTEWSLKKS